MSNRTQALQALLQPLAIERRGLRAMVASLLAGSDEPSAKTGRTPFGTVSDLQPDEAQGIGVIDVSGPLSKEDSIWQWYFGGTSYASITRQLEAAKAENISAVILNINSPGGDVFGCSETAKAIRDLCAVKPVYGYIAGQGDSAAYWLASACDKVVINATGEAGSIGVRCMLVDDSEFLKKLGVIEHDIVADQSPLKVVDASDPKDRARVQAQMTDFADVFIGDVAAYRGVSKDTVLSKFGKGDVMVGKSAVDAGLADEVGTLDSVLAELSAHTQENSMKVQGSAAKAETPNAAKPSAVKCSECKTDMGDEDDSYCSKCAKSASKAQSFASAVLGILGETDESKAIGAITGLKAHAEKSTEELVAVKAELATAKKEKADAEMASVLDKAVADGRVKKSARAQMEKLYADHGKAAFDAALAVLTPASEPAQPASDKTLEAAQPKADPAKPESHGLTAEDLKVIKLTGSTPEKFITQRNALRSLAKNGTINPAEEN